MDNEKGQAPEAAQTNPEPVVTEQQPEAKAPEATTPVEQTQQPVTEQSPTELYEARRAAKAQPKQEAPAEPEPEQKPEEGTEATEQQPETEEPEPDKKEKILPNRISTNQFNETEQEAIALLRELKKEQPDATIKDAYEIVERRQKEAKASEPEPEPEVDPTDAIVTKLKELKEQRRKMAEDGKLYETDLDELNDQIETLNGELSEIRAERKILERLNRQREEEVEHSKRKAAFDEARDKAVQMFPDLGDKDSVLYRAATDYIKELQDSEHPNHAMLAMPNGPILIAQHVAAQVATEMADESDGKISFRDAFDSLLPKPNKPAGQPKGAEPPKQAPVKKVTPASGAAVASPPTVQLPKNWDTMSPTDKLMWKRGARQPMPRMVLSV